MAITSYTDLKAAVADWLERSDLSSQIETFIQLAETRLSRTLEVRTMEGDASVTGTASSRYMDLPTDFREAKALWIVTDGQRRELRYLPASRMDASDTEGEPSFWTVDGTYIAFERPCDQAYDFVFRFVGGLDVAGIGAPTTFWLLLSNSQPSNYVLATYPDLYLFGSLVQAATYLQDDNMLARFVPLLEQAIDEVKRKESRSKGLAKLRTEISAEQVGSRASFSIYAGR